MKTKHVLIFLTVIGLFSIFLSPAPTKETRQIMPFVHDGSYCTECHSQEEFANESKDLTRACDHCCLKCHRDHAASHHKVGMEIGFTPPRGVYLKENNCVCCVTCHDLNHARFDSKPWRSQALFSRFIKGKSKYKTYYLVQNNSKGKLCKKCHCLRS